MPRSPRQLLVPLALLLGCFGAVHAGTPVVTSVFSKTSPDYHRKTQADGSFKREYYVIANGQYLPGPAANPSIDKVPFPQIAGLVGQYLARKNYYLAPKADDAEFLLLISWGTSSPFADPRRTDQLGNLGGAISVSQNAMANYKKALGESLQASGQNTTVGQALREAEAAAYQANDQLDSQIFQSQAAEAVKTKSLEANARLLGYVEELDDRNDASRFAGAGATYDDLISDLENERYYVIITAFDFKKLAKEGKKVPLWSTRVSIDARQNRFDQALETMVASAGKLFGQNSRGLERKPQEGRVTYGELQVLGVTGDSAPEKKPEPTPPPTEK